MDAPIRSEHHLIVLRPDPDAGEPTVLLVPDGGRWALPRIESEERRSADVTELNRAVRADFGVEVSVLRCLADRPGGHDRPRRHLYLLEAHGSPEASRGRWAPWAELRSTAEAASEPGGAGRVLAACQLRDSGIDWERPGWRDRTLGWVAEVLAHRGLPPVLEIEQVRVWEFAQVLRLTTAAGRFYFKARSPGGETEAPLTEALARRHPAQMPDVIGADAERRWLLMRETPGPAVMTVGDPHQWAAAAAAIAGVQIDWLDGTEELIALGCPHFTLGALAGEIAPLLDDGAILQPEHAKSLTDDEVAALRRRRPELEAMCRDLDGLGVPASLEHGDFWGDHALVTPGGPVLIDWEDAAVAHPFFSPALLLLSLHYTEALANVDDVRARIRNAYLRAWTERGPLAGWPAERLARAFDLAQRVALLYYAVQFRRGMWRVETSWEVRAFPTIFLRHLLAVL